MFLREIVETLETIKEVSTIHPEIAYGMERNLLLDVLENISLGKCQDAPPEDFAAEAFKVREIEYQW
jgi:hypothetical protein